jgi:Zn finger protein HypA/HybF involved in hydrogenase expression
MPLTLVTENAAYQCAQCGSILQMKKGQLLPPCPRCGGQLRKSEAVVSGSEDSCCKS